MLFDGQRNVPSSAAGLIDTNTFPQSLIERIEVAPGGASSAYGSDAIAGVVNFILDRDYEGFKASVAAGEVSEYGAADQGQSLPLVRLLVRVARDTCYLVRKFSIEKV